MTALPLDALKSKLQEVVDAQLALRWTPPAMAKSLKLALGNLAGLEATIKIADPKGNGAPPTAGRKTDALSLGVGVSASAAASISAGISLGIGFSATVSLLGQLSTGLNKTISQVATLKRDLANFNAEASLKAGTNGVMPPGRKIEQGPVNASMRGLHDNIGECQTKANAAAAGVPTSPISAELRQPRIGAWHCELDLDSDKPAGGKVKFLLDDLEFTGTVVPENTGVEGSRAKCKVVGGNGNLSKPISPHSYSGGTGVKVGTVVHDVLKDCGEDLSDLSDGPTLDKVLPRWHVAGGPTSSASQALTKIAEACHGAWRVMRDGTIWFGTETWHDVTPEGTLTNESWHNGHLTLAPETPNMVPGTVYQGQKIEHVTHSYGTTLRSHIRTTSVSAALTKALGGKQQEIDFSREYPCKVVTQNPDGTLQLLPDDEVMKSGGLDHVPIRYGMPGMKAKIANGARCHLAFAAGDPARPFVCSWEYDPSKVTLMSVLDGGQSLSRVGDLVQSGGPGTVVTLIPVLPSPPNVLPGILAPALGVGLPYLISFSAAPPTLVPPTATPLYGAVASGIPKFQG